MLTLEYNKTGKIQAPDISGKPINMTMTGREKLYFLLERIIDAREIAPSGQPLIIDPTNDLNRKYSDIELTQLFTKLEKDNQVLKILQIPSRIKTIDIVEDIDIYGTTYDHNDGCWHIELQPAFDSYYLKIQHEPEYQEFTGKKPPTDTIQESKTEQATKIANEFSPENYPFILRVLEKIASLTEFSSDDKVHYQLQSPPGQLLMQERSLLKKFEGRGLFKHLGEDDIAGIATLSDVNVDLIKQIITKIKEKESGVISENEFEEIKKKYNQTVQDLRESNQSSGLQERYNKILGEIKGSLKSSITVPQEEIQEQTPHPRLELTEEKKQTSTSLSEDQPTSQANFLSSYKLVFNTADGISHYRGATYQFTGKSKSLLAFLNTSKNTTFPLEEIKAKCNPNITNKRAYFKGDKDMRDTVNYIRKQLKVNKGEFFPIQKQDNNWIWVEK